MLARLRGEREGAMAVARTPCCRLDRCCWLRLRQGLAWVVGSDQSQSSVPPQVTPLRTTAQEVCWSGCTNADAVPVHNTLLFYVFCSEQEWPACLCCCIERLGLRLACMWGGEARTTSQWVSVCFCRCMLAVAMYGPLRRVVRFVRSVVAFVDMCV